MSQGGSLRDRARGFVRVLLLGVLALGMASARVAAGEKDWTDTAPTDVSGYSLERIRFTGPSDVPENELRGEIESSTSGWLRFRPIDLDALHSDVDRVRLVLRRHGYWSADVRLALRFDPRDRRVEATFEIEPGVQRIVGRISVQGERTYSTEEILSWTEQKEGLPFDVLLTARDRAAIENTYANRGFYLVQVVADIQPGDETQAPRVHDLVFRIDEGPRFLVGEVSIRGNVLTQDEIIRRELVFEKGTVLNRELLERSRNRLYSTGYFSRVEIRPQNVEESSGAVDVVVEVRERKMRFVGFGLGYGTRDQLRLSGEWGHRNLFGRGKRGSVQGVLASELQPVDLIRARIEGRFIEPWLFSTRNAGALTLSWEKQRVFTNSRQDEYDLSLVRLVLNVSRELTAHTNAWVGLENEWADVDLGPGVEIPDDERPNITRSATFTLDRDHRDNFFEPEEGFRNRLLSSVSGGILGGDNDFWRMQIEASTYKTWWATLAARVRVGIERPYGASDIVPDQQRFKLGGAASVRGYRYQEIGPGDFMVLANVETRFPLFWLFHGAAFLDGGNAWDRAQDVHWEDFDLNTSADESEVPSEFRYAVGMGLRFSTPVGPVRLDAARKLKILESDDRDWGYHLSLGHVF